MLGKYITVGGLSLLCLIAVSHVARAEILYQRLDKGPVGFEIHNEFTYSFGGGEFENVTDIWLYMQFSVATGQVFFDQQACGGGLWQKSLEGLSTGVDQWVHLTGNASSTKIDTGCLAIYTGLGTPTFYLSESGTALPMIVVEDNGGGGFDPTLTQTSIVSVVLDSDTGKLNTVVWVSPVDFASTSVEYLWSQDYGSVAPNIRQELHIATTSGFNGWSDYYWQPDFNASSTASTTLPSVFTGKLYSTYGDVFAGGGMIVFDEFSTSTDVGYYEYDRVSRGFADNCRPFSAWWDVPLCLNYLIVPKTTYLASTSDRIYRDVLSKVPFGYLTRMMTFFTTDYYVALPKIEYTFGTSSVLYSTIGSISFDPFGALVGTSSLLAQVKSDQATQKTLWEIMETPINIVVYLTLLVMMIRDVTGLSGLAEGEVEGEIYGNRMEKRRRRNLFRKSITSHPFGKYGGGKDRA